MAKRTIAICALIGACAAPAGASVLTIGSTNARQCFESADTPLLLPRETDIRHCDEALALDNLTTGDLVATHVNRGILRGIWTGFKTQVGKHTIVAVNRRST